jgi:hypothetical protein
MQTELNKVVTALQEFYAHEAFLLEKDLGASLVEATGLGEEFPVVQKTVARLRDNLLRATHGESEKS